MVGYRRVAIPAPFTNTCYCGTLQYIAPSFPQANIDAAACLHYSSGWGGISVVVLLVAGRVYLDGGVGYKIKVRGKAPGLEALPHRLFWGAVLGLVADGVGFTRAQLQQTMSGPGGGDLSEKLAQGSVGPEAPGKPPAAEGPAKGGCCGGVWRCWA